jgi:5-carboxymethyl-2-hydroxymuconate isomerase
MPQITFEHSANLTGIDYENLFIDIYQVVAKFPNMGTCKIRAVAQENYYIGTENGENAFAFLRVLMKPNKERTDQFRDNMAKDLMPIIKRYLDPVKKQGGIKCFPTVEVGTLSEQYYWIEDRV